MSRDDNLKLYAFQPDGHGPYSFFVMAKSEADAREAIEGWRITEGLEKDNYNMGGYYDDDDDYDYELTVLKEGEVIVNDND